MGCFFYETRCITPAWMQFPAMRWI